MTTADIAAIQNKVSTLEEENLILKKAMVCSQGLKDRVAAICQLSAELDVKLLELDNIHKLLRIVNKICKSKNRRWKL